MYCKTFFWEIWSSFDNVAKVMLRLFLICSYLGHTKRWATVRSLLQVHLGWGELLKRCPWFKTVCPIRSLVSTIESFLLSNWIHFQGSVCGLMFLNLLCIVSVHSCFHLSLTFEFNFCFKSLKMGFKELFVGSFVAVLVNLSTVSFSKIPQWLGIHRKVNVLEKLWDKASTIWIIIGCVL
jgi:hypothetical protein